jgi:hypothetical protein
MGKSKSAAFLESVATGESIGPVGHGTERQQPGGFEAAWIGMEPTFQNASTVEKWARMADDTAYRLSHPELSNFTLNIPDPDSRSFRATQRRAGAFRRVLEHYWAGGFHPQAIGTPTAENAIMDRAFEPSQDPPKGLMDPATGPLGTPQEVFQTNFVFGRALRSFAQSVKPGYWQSVHPNLEGFEADQIMRYS